MHILEIVSGAQINGAVVHCALLCREFERRRHTVTLLCRHGAKIKGMLSDTSVTLIESDLHRFPLDELRRIGAIARSGSIDVIHTHMTRAHNFGVLLRRFSNIPCVATAHSHIVQPLTWMFNDHVIAVSDATKRFQEKWNFIKPANIDTVYGFTDYERQLSTAADAGATIRAVLGIGERTAVIGIIGDIIPRKGHLHLFRALVEIRRVIPDVSLLVVGDPKRRIGAEYNIKVRNEAERLGVAGNIIWAGYRTDVADIMRALDVYVLASLDEMFPVAVLEAMAARRAIVATNVGGVPECLKDGETGLIVPSEDSGALSEAILKLLGDRELAGRLAGNAQKVVRDQFSVQSQAPRIEAIFQRVITRYNAMHAAGASHRKSP